jgi:hypothetical protein
VLGSLSNGQMATSLADDIVSTIEVRALWSRFGF